MTITLAAPNNTAPVVDAGSDGAIDEGGSFTDPDQDPWTGTVDYGDGSGPQPLSLNVDKTFSLSHTYADDGDYITTVKVDDGHNQATGTIQLTVGNVAPTLTISGPSTVQEGATYTLHLSASDPGDDTISRWDIDWGEGPPEQVSGNPSSATHVYTNGGQTYTVTATATDEDGTFSANSVQVTVHTAGPGVSQPTVAHPIGDVVVEQGSAETAIDLSDVFYDQDIPSGDHLTLSLTSNNNPGLVSAVLTGTTLTLTYVEQQLGTATITVRATDDAGQWVEDDFAATVTSPLQVPAAFDDAYRTDHGQMLSIDAASGALANDFDPNGDVLQAVKLADPASGSLTLNADGSFDYTPNAGFTGTDTFTYKATDGVHESQEAAVTITVTNHAPIVGGDAYQTKTGQALQIDAAQGVLANDFDFQGDTLSVLLVDSPANGTLTLNADGSFSYAPGAGFLGTDSFTYRADDGIAPSELATVTIEGDNDAPAAVGDWYYVTHDVPWITDVAGGVLANDLDPEGDRLDAALVDSPSHGTLTLNSDGSFTYTPDAGYVGTDPFTYKASDAFAESGVATVTLEVVHHAPVARLDTYYLVHDTALTVDAAGGALANDADAENDGLFVTLDGTVAHGTLALNTDGSFIYTPNAGFVGTDSFTYKASDGLADSDVVTVTLEVANTAPTALGDSYSVHAGQTLSVAAPGILDNDLDAESDPLTASLVSNVTGGMLTLNADGSFTYTPGAGFIGSDTFTYTANDKAAVGEAATVTIEVLDAAPWAVDASYSMVHDTALTVNAPGLFDLVGDPDDDPLTISLVQDVTSGTLTLNADGSFTYVPDPDFAGTDNFQFKAGDGHTQSQPATVTLNVTNMAPAAVQDHYTVSHDTDLTIDALHGVLANDSDGDGDSLSAAGGASPAHGSLALNANGSFTYTPTAGYIGTDEFSYQASDGIDQTVATVTIEVTNSAPYSANDTYGVLQDQSLSVDASAGVWANDVDVDGDSVTISLVDDVSHGTLTLNADGSFTYTPEAGYAGTDRFTYQATDGTPTGNGNKATVTFTVHSDPLVVEDDIFQTLHDSPLSGDVTANDFNWDQVPVTAVLASDVSHGSLTLNADGTFDYAPHAGFVGTDTFTYQRDDGSQLTDPAVVTIAVVNSAPVATGATYGVSHDRTLSVSADGLGQLVYDGEEDSVTFSLVDNPTHGTLTLNADGSFAYSPVAGFVGTDTFTYRASDGLADSNVATVTIDVTNASPLGFPDAFATHHDTPLSVTGTGVLANDQDADGDSLAAVLVDDVAHGTLVLHADGSFEYTPSAGYVGHDSFSYKANDGLSDGQTVTVTLEVTNTAPSGLADSYETLHDEALAVDAAEGVLQNDEAWDGDPLSAALVASPGHGAVTLAADGSFTYSPHSQFAGEDTFTYRVADSIAQSEPVTVTISVTNRGPMAASDAYSTGRKASLTVAAPGVLGNDVDLDGDSLVPALASTVSHGALSLNADGSFTYTPDAGYLGTDSFSYTLSDGVSQSDPATVDIQVENTAPSSAADSYQVAHDTTLEMPPGDLLLNDFDHNGDALTVHLVHDVLHGTLVLNPDGSFTYTPQAGYVGFDRFTYRTSDGLDDSAAAVVSIEVLNTRPAAHDGYHRVVHGQSLNVDAASGLLQTSTDPEGDTLTVTVLSDVNHGTLTVNADGSYSYSPDAGFVGTDSFAYKVSDGLLDSTTATVTIDVTNTPPSAGIDLYELAQNSPLIVSAAEGVLANDRDLDNDTLSAALLDDVAFGTLLFHSDGSFTYTPHEGYAGFDSFSYRLSDGVKETTATVLLTVTGVNANPSQPPTGRNDWYQTPHGRTLDVGYSAGVLSNDVDQQGDRLTAVLVSGPAHGTLTLNEDGSFQYTPSDANFVGQDSFVYQADDGTNRSDATTVTLEIINDPPSAPNVAFHVHHSTELVMDYGSLLDRPPTRTTTT